MSCIRLTYSISEANLATLKSAQNLPPRILVGFLHIAITHSIVSDIARHDGDALLST